MITSMTNARITGVLFIMGTVPMIIALTLWGQFTTSPAYLTVMATHRVEVLALALVCMIMGLACAGIGISMYPVLKPHGEAAALGVLGFRVIEGALQVLSATGIVVLLALSTQYVQAGSPSTSYFQSIGAMIKDVREWMQYGFALFPWCIGASLYYFIFFKTKLLPRWLSVWGFVGLALMLACAFSVMFGGLNSAAPLVGILMLPIAAQEMVMALWLIIKGYNQADRSGNHD